MFQSWDRWTRDTKFAALKTNRQHGPNVADVFARSAHSVCILQTTL